MRTMILLLALFSASISHASKTLYCHGDAQAFTADYIATSDYVELRRAKVTGAFTDTSFICAGHSILDGVKCAGFWNGKSNELLEVSFKVSGAQIEMSYNSLTGQKKTAQPWDCTIETNEF